MTFGKQTLEPIIQSALKDIGVSGEITFSVEQPEDVTHGDYATNAALVVSKQLKLSPKECAEKIKDALLGKNKDIVRIDIAGPGFINFFLSDDTIRSRNRESIDTLATKYTGKNVLVEHSSPNLFKPFHIGHLMNNIIGEFVVRATKMGGADTRSMSFPSDVSLGIAKAVYVILDDIKNGNDFFRQNLKNESKIIPYLGECYKRGVTLHEEKPELENAIKGLSEKLFSDIDHETGVKSDAYEIYNLARMANTSYFENILREIGTEITHTIYESEAGAKGLAIIKNNPHIFPVGEKGAIIYIPDEDRKDLNTSVFVNSEGHPTYEAKDLGLIEKKFTEFGKIDCSYFITDAEQAHHFKIVLDAASKLGGEWPEWVEKSKHIPHGRMTFKGQKMSSRLGGVPLALDVISAVEEEVKERYKIDENDDKLVELSPEEREKLVREIALSALRISVLRSKPGININFDPETSLSLIGDTGPYLLYAHARCASLLDKGKEKPVFADIEATTLERNLIHAEEVFIKAIDDLAPQILVGYLFSVAQLFNTWYADVQIITDDKKITAHNLAIVARVKTILKKGLYILGIEAPERM